MASRAREGPDADRAGISAAVNPFAPSRTQTLHMTIKAISAPTTPAGLSATSSDDVLVARARAGDSRAFELLAERHSTPLRRVLYRITRDCEAAKDAVQEALVSAWRSIGGFEGRSRFSTWFTRIGINAAYSGMRGQRELTFDPQDGIGEQVPDWGSRPDEVFESREFLAAVDVALGELPTDYRTAVVLRDVEGYSTAEAAGMLGIEERALKSRLHRGRMALRAQLDDHFAEEAS
jgi:RNA polymerase sigma-70 factor (ECF subfamily)